MDLDKCYVLDIESSGLLADMLDFSSFPYKLKADAKLWWVVVRNVATGEVRKAAKENITKEWLKESLKDAEYVVGHNAFKFDFIVLQLFGVFEYTVGYIGEKDTIFGRQVTLIDTIILSRLLSPDRFGGHSLGAWGERLKNSKIDFRKASIDAGLIEKNTPKGAEFGVFSELMGTYCEGDTSVNVDLFKALLSDLYGNDWRSAIRVENKLADLAIRRESFGFWFDKDLALKCLDDLTEKMDDLRNKVNPKLPPKPMNKSEMGAFTPPNTQLNKEGHPSHYIQKFAERIGGTIVETDEKEYALNYEDKLHPLPIKHPLKTTAEADISNLDHVKTTLIDVHGWSPTEWAERDFTKDSKKVSLPYEKRITAIERWFKETDEGKYKKDRLEIAKENYKVKSTEELLSRLKDKLKEDFPVRLPTSPKVRVGVEKDLCPNLVALGEKVEFANDFALYLTYKHRKSSIAGGEIEDMDFEIDTPNTGFLSMYREEDGRVATPAIEIGSNTHRYRHIGICNISRPTSVYGKEMRSLFGCGKGAVQLGFDFSSLEARIESHYVWKYTNGQELSKNLLAEKPNDIHTVTAKKLGISRNDSKSINYGILYGASIKKVQKMLRCTPERAAEIYESFWKAVPALKELKDNIEKFWSTTGEKQWIPSLDGRKIKIRSSHSSLNALLQSGGVICAKYVTVFLMEELEKLSYKIDPFESPPDVCSMIEYHKPHCGFA